MALDKLVDSAQLDNNLTSIANAIRTKGGTSAQMAFPQGFVDAVEAIETGGGEKLEDLVYSVAAFSLQGCTLKKKDTVLDFGNVNVSNFSVNKATSAYDNASLEIKCKNLTFATGAISDQSGSSKLRTIIFSCENNPQTVSEFARATKISRILGKPLLTYGFSTGNYRYFNSSSITEFYLVPNKITTGASGINTGVLVDASIVSVANALKGGLATAQTLTISNATTKAKCNTIMGTVSQVTDGDETYDFFTQDQENGTVTLADFITTVKGWTIA